MLMKLMKIKEFELENFCIKLILYSQFRAISFYSKNRQKKIMEIRPIKFLFYPWTSTLQAFGLT